MYLMCFTYVYEMTRSILLGDAVEYTVEEGKLKLQLYPIDEATRKSMEQACFS